MANFATRKAHGAWPRGTRVILLRDLQGQSLTVPKAGTIVGSEGLPTKRGTMFAYYVSWEDTGKTSLCFNKHDRLRRLMEA